MVKSDSSPLTLRFNPRSRGGSDLFLNFSKITINKFQSTLPWWERHNHVMQYGLNKQFQSTLPWWERLRLFFMIFIELQFQSTLPWWERLY